MGFENDSVTRRGGHEKSDNGTPGSTQHHEIIEDVPAVLLSLWLVLNLKEHTFTATNRIYISMGDFDLVQLELEVLVLPHLYEYMLLLCSL